MPHLPTSPGDGQPDFGIAVKSTEGWNLYFVAKHDWEVWTVVQVSSPGEMDTYFLDI